MTIPRLNELVVGEGGIFVPDEESKQLNMLIRDASCVEKLATHVPMARLILNMRKQADGVDGYWVDAMAVKPKDTPSFEVYHLQAEKLAVIIPLEDQLVEDADTDIASVIRQDVVGAFAEMLDRTYMGYEVTSPFADSLSGNTPAANTIPYGTGVDLASDFSIAMAALEANGFEATAAIAHPSVKHLLRDLRDLNNQPIFAENLKGEVTSYTVFGVPICFTRQVQQAGSPLTTEILLFYRPYVKIGDRTGLQISKSNEATLSQGTETPLNLWEVDMTAFRFVMRKGFVVKDDNALSKITGVPAALPAQ
jgi:HK97 family phage major capsid protein